MGPRPGDAGGDAGRRARIQGIGSLVAIARKDVEQAAASHAPAPGRSEAPSSRIPRSRGDEPQCLRPGSESPRDSWVIGVFDRCRYVFDGRNFHPTADGSAERRPGRIRSGGTRLARPGVRTVRLHPSRFASRDRSATFSRWSEAIGSRSNRAADASLQFANGRRVRGVEPPVHSVPPEAPPSGDGSR